MEQFDFNSKQNEKLEKLKSLVNEGLRFGMDLKELLNKIKNIQDTLNKKVIKIALIGTVSDGKTSTIAGLIGKIDSSMKIDIDESTDELKIYRPENLKTGFEIIDTPGLFGTKEKDDSGQIVKYSDITKNYLSEAHIIIYVCDAVNPLKDSHVPVIKWILRDLGKLNSTVFVINKMDEAYDLLDEEAFVNGTKTKKQNLITKLRSTIKLTPKEEHDLHIVCIAADPKMKGIDYWLTKYDEYKKRSHIELLRNLLYEVERNCDDEKLTSSMIHASVKDVFDNLSKEIKCVNEPINTALSKSKGFRDDLNENIILLKKDLDSDLKAMQDQMDSFKNSLIKKIKIADSQTIGDIIDEELGMQDEHITFYVFERNVNRIMSGCVGSIDKNIGTATIEFETKFSEQEKFITDSIKKGEEILKNVKISPDQIKHMRDLLFKDSKFEPLKPIRDLMFKDSKFQPWGAIKMADKYSKLLNKAGGALSAIPDLWSYVRELKDHKKLEKLKKDILNVLNSYFSEIYEKYQDESSYYKNFAPIYLEMKKRLEDRDEEIKLLKNKIDELEAYRTKITSWVLSDSEDVEYEEV